jgi:hypothetical protein
MWLLAAGAVVALIVVAVLMFSTPHATYQGNVNNSGTVGEGAITTPCISAWNEMAGNFAHPYVPTNTYAFYNYEAAGSACYTVIHGRQHLSIFLLLVAVALGVGAALVYRADNRAHREWDQALTEWESQAD